MASSVGMVSTVFTTTKQDWHLVSVDLPVAKHKIQTLFVDQMANGTLLGAGWR